MFQNIGVMALESFINLDTIYLNCMNKDDTYVYKFVVILIITNTFVHIIEVPM